MSDNLGIKALTQCTCFYGLSANSRTSKVNSSDITCQNKQGKFITKI